MPKVTIFDADGEKHEYDADMGETLWDACLNAGVSLAHSCGYGCQCGTCRVIVLEGHTNLTHVDEEEKERCDEDGMALADPADPNGGSDIKNNKPKFRLSCACQVNGDVMVAEPEV